MTPQDAAITIAKAVTEQYKFWELSGQQPSLDAQRALVTTKVYKVALATIEEHFQEK